jgi:hypothetical protein
MKALAIGFKAVLIGFVVCCSALATAQQPSPSPVAQRAAEIQQLRLELQQISARLDVLERESATETPSTSASTVTTVSPATAVPAPIATAEAATAPATAVKPLPAED